MRRMRPALFVWLASLGACTQLAGIERAHEIQASSCTQASECNDAEACSDDSCEAGFCLHAARPDGPAPGQKSGDCQRVQCTAGKSSTVPDDTDIADDMLQCTKDACAAGMPTHTPVEKNSACNDGGGKRCDGKGACVECVSDDQCTKPNLCGSLKPNQCGCAPIPCANVGLTCGFAPDDGCGKALVCNDGKQNGGETDIDCGGPVASCSQRCNEGKKCMVGADCASGNCDSGSKMCTKP